MLDLIALKSDFKEQKIYITHISIADLKNIKDSDKSHDCFQNVIFVDSTDACLWTEAFCEISPIESYSNTGKLSSNLDLCSKSLNIDISSLNDTDRIPVVFVKNF